MKHAYSSRRVVLVVISGVTFYLSTCISAVAQTGCICSDEEVALWSRVEPMPVDQPTGMLILFVLLIALVGVGSERVCAISSAVKQSRAYESRVLAALYYGCVDEAIEVAALFPRSPLAVVVEESFRAGKRVEKVTASQWALDRALVFQTTSLKRWLWTLNAIGWTSPIVGLLTTLAPSARYMSGPSLPLCFGLLIAIPAIWLYRGLSAEVDTLLLETDRMSLSIIDQMAEQLEAAV